MPPSTAQSEAAVPSTSMPSQATAKLPGPLNAIDEDLIDRVGCGASESARYDQESFNHMFIHVAFRNLVFERIRCATARSKVEMAGRLRNAADAGLRSLTKIDATMLPVQESNNIVIARNAANKAATQEDRERFTERLLSEWCFFKYLTKVIVRQATVRQDEIGVEKFKRLMVATRPSLLILQKETRAKAQSTLECNHCSDNLRRITITLEDDIALINCMADVRTSGEQKELFRRGLIYRFFLATIFGMQLKYIREGALVKAARLFLCTYLTLRSIRDTPERWAPRVGGAPERAAGAESAESSPTQRGAMSETASQPNPWLIQSRAASTSPRGAGSGSSVISSGSSLQDRSTRTAGNSTRDPSDRGEGSGSLGGSISKGRGTATSRMPPQPHASKRGAGMILKLN